MGDWTKPGVKVSTISMFDPRPSMPVPDRSRQLSGRPLLVLHTDAAFLARLKKACQPGFLLVPLQGWEELQRMFPRLPSTGVVLLDPYEGQGRSRRLSEKLKEFLRAYPSATVVAAVEGGPETFYDLRTLGEWGVAQVLSLELDVTPYAVRQRVETAMGRSLRHALFQALPDALGSQARSIVDAALETAAGGRGAADLSRSLLLSERTLVRRCADSGLPAPRFLLRWMRLVIAAGLLDDPGRNVMDAALACGYSSDASLRRALRRCGLPNPAALRKGAAFEAVVGGFLADLGPRTAS
jgi:AraC-like DNA-binding protein